VEIENFLQEKKDKEDDMWRKISTLPSMSLIEKIKIKHCNPQKSSLAPTDVSYKQRNISEKVDQFSGTAIKNYRKHRQVEREVLVSTSIVPIKNKHSVYKH